LAKSARASPAFTINRDGLVTPSTRSNTKAPVRATKPQAMPTINSSPNLTTPANTETPLIKKVPSSGNAAQVGQTPTSTATNSDVENPRARPTRVKTKWSDLSKKVLGNFGSQTLKKGTVKSSPRSSKVQGVSTLPRMPSAKSEDILQILGQSTPKRDTLSIPSEFPPRPLDPGEFDKEKKNEEAYKEYMRKKLDSQNWENALMVYYRKDKDLDFSGMAIIIYRLVAESNTNNSYLNDNEDVPIGYPSLPSSNRLSDADVEETNQKKKDIHAKINYCKKLWLIYMKIYRRKLEEGDSQACADIVRIVQSEVIGAFQQQNTLLLAQESQSTAVPLSESPVAISPSFGSPTDIPNNPTTNPSTVINHTLPYIEPIALDDFDFPDFGDVPDLGAELKNIDFPDIDPLDFDDW
jgi:hypothetical protein